MKLSLQIFLLVLYFSCSTVQKNKLVETGNASFRITLNSNKSLSEKEIDSLEKTKPFYGESFRENKFYNLLVTKGFVSSTLLDTSRLNLSLVSWDHPVANFGQTKISLDTTNEIDHIVVQNQKNDWSVDLGPRLLGDIFVSYLDLDRDGKKELLVMSKHYIMGGYSFDLRDFEFR